MSAGALMEYGEKKALSAVTGSAETAVTTYVAMITAAPTATDATMAAESEFSTGTGYARAAYSPGSPSSASPSVIGNGSTMTYGPFGSAPGTCSWAILTDASSGTSSNCICAYLLANARTPLTGDSLSCAASSFTIQV
jgi:hypothetical protein